MALTEIQKQTKEIFYGKIQNAGTEMDLLIGRWRDLSEFIGRVDVTDLDDMGVATGQIRTDLIKFRTVLDEFINLYDGNSVTPSDIPSDVIELIRRM